MVEDLKETTKLSAFSKGFDVVAVDVVVVRAVVFSSTKLSAFLRGFEVVAVDVVTGGP